MVIAKGIRAARGITSDSDNLCVLVLRGGTSRELVGQRNKQSLLSHLALCDPVVP